MQQKMAKRLERVFKGVANHNRVRILEYIAEQKEVPLWQISEILKIEFRNASQHAARLEKAGLIKKKYLGRAVMHTLTPYGQHVYKFSRSLQTF